MHLFLKGSYSLLFFHFVRHNRSQENLITSRAISRCQHDTSATVGEWVFFLNFSFVIDWSTLFYSLLTSNIHTYSKPLEHPERTQLLQKKSCKHTECTSSQYLSQDCISLECAWYKKVTEKEHAKAEWGNNQDMISRPSCNSSNLELELLLMWNFTSERKLNKSWLFVWNSTSLFGVLVGYSSSGNPGSERKELHCVVTYLCLQLI